ncbi:FAD-dependent oxidoreductase [Aureimonas fodinaquatilis]|uniref:FAD-dependent oxidoreductase n=1 Tax=Aureimonas fodinaquatilis TaxID=2565783 RepID=A0A5B0DWM2_9HYPH|nr:FAD-dependent oxidoreductase [Aureimonas fodinaquatilis]KAA0970896.1 FAD-dependent oxidoreductase [Aureimonas fodinaquatilis]
MTGRFDWYLTADVVVVGAGGAGLVSAINAYDAGSSVLVLEKMSNPGGITILAGGGVKAARDVEGAVSYLTHTQGGRVSEQLIRTFAEGLVELPDYLRGLAEVNGATVTERNETHEGIYPFPGAESLYSLTVTDLDDFDGYHWAYTGKNLAGQRFFKILLDNVRKRDIEIRTDSPASELIIDNGEVVGLWALIDGEKRAVRANRGVILASGGFEFNEKLKKEFFEATPVYAVGNPGNTGDGILMAQKAGAALWHMWHFHGSYGFKFDDFDTAFRIAPGGARNSNRPVSWIVVDSSGKRFMNELHPATQDTAARPLGVYDPDVPAYTRIPAYLIFDEEGRKIGRIANPLTTHPDHRYVWSEDNLAEIERGWIKRFDSLEELATAHGWSVETLHETVENWNRIVRSGGEDEFHRPAGTRVSIDTGPFYAVPVWPLLTNTQGGPEHDEKQRVLDAFGAPIPRLFAVGELGSFFAHLYLLGGNLSELIISGRIAGHEAAQLKSSAETARGLHAVA